MPRRRPVAVMLRPPPPVRIGVRKWAVLLPFSIPRGSLAGDIPRNWLFAALGLNVWACVCQAVPVRRSVTIWLLASPPVRIGVRKWLRVLPFVIPRGSYAGVFPWFRLFAALWLCLLVCACSASFFHLQLCPFRYSHSFFVAPSKMLGDVDDPRWPIGVPIVLVVARLLSSCAPMWQRRKRERCSRRVHFGRRARIFWMRPQVCPRRVVWCSRNGRGDCGVWLPETCAGALQILCVLGLVRFASGFLFRRFVIVGVVRPMVHWSNCARKPRARAVAERTSGTTRGSTCRVTLSGAFFRSNEIPHKGPRSHVA